MNMTELEKILLKIKKLSDRIDMIEGERELENKDIDNYKIIHYRIIRAF